MKHVVGMLLLWVALWCSIPVQVGEERLSIAQVAEVYGLSALDEQEQIVKLVEQDSWRSMDGTSTACSISAC